MTRAIRATWRYAIVVPAVALAPGVARAQPAPAVVSPSTSTPVASPSTSAPVVSPSTSTPVASPSAGAPDEADHDRFVGHVAFGYLLASQIPIAVPGTDPVTGTTVTAPVIGVRYWFQRRVGIDAGLGFGLSNAYSSETTSTNTYAIAVHGGVPLALLIGSHYTLEVIPEALLGGSFGTVAGHNLSGLRADLGVRVGGEIHFGFIGIPQLALQGTIEVYFSHQSYTDNSATSGTNVLSTSVQADPWAIFTDNITALYYF